MITLTRLVAHFLFFILIAFSLVIVFPSQSLAQGKKIFVGTGSGFIDYPNAQTTLNLHDDDTVVINPGKYKLMNFRNITASPGHKIYIINSGQVEFNDPSPSTFSNLTNVEIRGDGTPGIPFGFYLHDLIRGISIDGTMSGVYFSYFKMVNIIDYGVFFYNPLLLYNGTNSKTSLYYDIKFLHFSVSNIKTTFLQLGLFGRVIDDGLVSIIRKLEVAYCTVDNSDQQDVFHLSKVINANIHHNRLSHLGKNDFRHTGIIYLYGSGEVHHNYISDYWGSGLRAHSFNLDTTGVVNIYNNVMVGSRKYSGIEAQCTPEDIAYSPYMRYCNFKIFNNTFGNLSAADWQAAMVDSYNAAGGTIEIKNNLGFNIQRDKPFDPGKNYVYSQLNITKPDTAGNLYGKTYTDIGLVNDSSCLLNANSPAIDKGVTANFITDDIDGVIRPQSGAFDIGAHEYLTGIVFPVSNAGRDTSTVLPKDSIILNGSASYNPTGGLLTYKWTQVAGPSTAVIQKDTSAKPVLKNLKQGVYQVKLSVTNPQGHSNDDVVVIAVSPVPVFPPVANAGGTTTITLPVNSTGLNGSASSNGAGGALKYAWTKISGPASFAVSGDSTVSPFISSLAEGIYQVKLIVTNNSGLSDIDTATIIVKPAPVPTANAGADTNIILPANSTVLNGTASTTPGGGPLSYAWTKVSGPAAFTIAGDITARPSVSNLTEGVYQVKLTVTNNSNITSTDFVNITVSAAPVAIASAGTDINIVLPTNTALLDGTASRSTGGGVLTYEWSLVSGPAALIMGGGSTSTPSIINLIEGVYQIRLKVTNIQGYVSADTVLVTVSAEPVYTPVSNAGPDITIALPASSVVLNGEQSYNPGGGALTYAWSLVSGPSAVVITGAASATPTINNLVEGAYQLKLVVTNVQGISAEDQVTINVSPAPPSPPVANAGADVLLVLPENSATLDGGASVNSAGDPLTYAWSLVSGPSSFVISGANSSTPIVSNLAAGSYHIKLIVTNAQGLSAEDVVTVTVNIPVAPVANAGDAVNLVLPVNKTTLNGGASYQPGGGALNYEWAKISGPAAFTISGNTSATPFVDDLTEGSYLIRLTVTNSGGIVAMDTLSITVSLPSLPVAIAGNDTAINFPGGYVMLDGSKSHGSDGAGIARYQWKQVSGPTTALIDNSAISQSSATNLEPGVYIFQLIVTDDYGQVATSNFTVTVANSVPHNKKMTLYPNPCLDKLNVHLIADATGASMVRIASLSGVVMLNQAFQKNQLVADVPVVVSRLPEGVYIIEIIIGKQVQLLGKFAKQ